jgi:hypothetical protein
LWKASPDASYIEILMKSIILFILLVGLCYIGKGQVLRSRIDSFVKVNKVDSFLVYTRFLQGKLFLDSCQWEEPHYLFWRQHGQWLLKKFDYCVTSKNVVLGSFNPLKFYFSNKRRISQEEIKPPTYYQVILKNGRKDTLSVTSTASHQPFFHFEFVAGDTIKKIEISEYELEFKSFESGQKNIYYSINQKTKLKKLVDVTSTLIKNMTAEKRFTAE